ncbi:Nuclear Hormone Receptor family [Caenorhabditis elegans]|uniref:Nuclear Hormone Receptor family n=1 Tax=Caenorhabditis elegans TaxID=6239 RepID=Q9XXB5_CAEEL|nr:Nuclear Hormone Receptor family [Caenorhabditis elegans]CAA19558.2 Nuclear Hormone Receptor family [Caenorhabditis elegans]|eukprot:NP_493446.2 Nuclear Hormone Receptor family [Caenorhabditis elegans]
MEVHLCQICSNPKCESKYGFFLCSACCSFFRRNFHEKSPPNYAAIMNKFFNLPCSPGHVNCKKCRFDKCLEVGLIRPVTDNRAREMAANLNLVNLIQTLKDLDITRADKFSNYNLIGPTSPADAILIPVKYSAKKLQNPTCHHWSLLNQITTIDFLKKINFPQAINPEDQGSIIRSGYIKHMLFSTAFLSYTKKLGEMRFPDGSDIFDAEILKTPEFSHRFLREIRELLVDKLANLKVTQEEYLLLSVIFLCSEASPLLSEDGKAKLPCIQRMYASCLLHYCCLQNSKSAPARFTELLSIWIVILQTFKNFSHFVTLVQLIGKETVFLSKYDNLMQFANS